MLARARKARRGTATRDDERFLESNGEKAAGVGNTACPRYTEMRRMRYRQEDDDTARDINDTRESQDEGSRAPR